MTSNQRRPGFRLPWASEAEAADAEAATIGTVEAVPTAEVGSEDGASRPVGAPMAESPAPVTNTDLTAAAAPPAEDAEPQSPPDEAPARATASAPAPTTSPTRSAPEPSSGFMRDLITAMRGVAEETRQAGLSELRTKAEEQVRSLEADSEKRRQELKARAETDVAAVGEWARTESERIKREAEQRVVARRASLDQELAAEATRSESEAAALRDRVAAYERELDAYHAQLSDIADPAAFAAAAKRMPAPPLIEEAPTPSGTEPQPVATPTSERPQARANGTTPAAAIHPAEEEVLASRLAELDAALEPVAEPAVAASSAQPTSTEPTSTEILVKGLGSFGAITGFRQALAGVDGIEGVSLSLGPTGEFVFRAIHPAGFDVTAAIAKLEGDAAKIESLPEGGLRVTLDRAR